MFPLLDFGPSAEPVGLSALVLGTLCLGLWLFARRRLEQVLDRIPARAWVAALALGALLLSAGYILYFLRGGPRIIDATSYYLEARGLSTGHLAFAVPEPTAAFRGRFTLLGPSGLSVIFPPGYPLLLALGFRLGAPLAIGPALAALLVVGTFVAARELGLGERTARTAALVSALCAALRYHTADTMSHGLAALLLLGSVTAALHPTRARCLLSGLLIGWLVATRPMTGVVAVIVSAMLLLRGTVGAERARRLTLGAAATLPGLLLLAAHQRAATGSFLHSTQLAYYALADGPPGCFRWGFGAGVGCRFEHGDFVQKHLAGGYGLLPALYVTGERLLWHAFDLADSALLAPLVPWILWRKRAVPGVRLAGLSAALVVAVYAPFYFPGSYPGGGARLLADALPFEHVLIASALVELELSALAPALLLLGFGLNGVHAHLALRDREGGRPMFEARFLSARGVSHGLVFTNTDHGFALGHDPAATDARTSVLVARAHGDAHDLALWRALGRPPAYDASYSTLTGETQVSPIPLMETRAQPAWRWELEAEWPVLGASGGWVHPDFAACLSRGAGLRVLPVDSAAVSIELGAPRPGLNRVSVGWLADPGARLSIVFGNQRVNVVHGPPGCEVTNLGVVALPEFGPVGLKTNQSIVVDYFDLEPAI
jgi:hypothetical protein